MINVDKFFDKFDKFLIMLLPFSFIGFHLYISFKNWDRDKSQKVGLILW